VPSEALIQDPMAVLAVLLGVLALLFAMARDPRLGKVFKIIPLLISSSRSGCFPPRSSC
jgi:hypothetical protein